LNFNSLLIFLLNLIEKHTVIVASLFIHNFGLKVAPVWADGSVVTIGNFDGIHLGHQALIGETLRLSAELALPSAALTFDPHPASLFKNLDDQPVMTLDQRARGLREYGVNRVLVQHFDQFFAELSPNDFVTKFLAQELRAKAVVVGSDFRFGKDRAGSVKDLLQLGSQHGIHISAIPVVGSDGIEIRSSFVRQILKGSGDVRRVRDLLNRPYLLEGQVTPGDQRGRQIGFPTLNLQGTAQILPKFGVYCGWLHLCSTNEHPVIIPPSSGFWPCVLNIGKRPTFDGAEVRIEAHVIDQKLPMNGTYGNRVGIYFQFRLRDESRFADVDALRATIARDIDFTRQLLA
jgi:riboflavin kinase/FMN adenylyltransferase